MSFVEKTVIMDSTEMRRALRRIAHEIVEANKGTRGSSCWACSAGACPSRESSPIPSTRSRDRGAHGRHRHHLLPRRPVHHRAGPRVSTTDVPLDITGKEVILVDDVLYTGRTVRAGHGRHHGMGPSQGHPPGRADRPRPSRAAHPSRLRGQERADLQREIIKVRVQDFDDAEQVVVGEVQAE